VPKAPRQPRAGRTLIATLEIGDDSADLVEEGGRDLVRGPHGSVEVSLAEKAMLGECGDIVSAYLRADDRDDAQLPPGLSSMRSALGDAPLAVMLDTTTYFNAVETLAETPTPTGILDLALLTVAAVGFDTIIVQPEPFASTGAAGFADFTHILDLDPHDAGTLRDLYIQSLRLAERRRDQYERNWEAFLDMPVTLDLSSVYARVEERYWPSDTVAEPPMDPEVLRDFVGVQTTRAWFNDIVASGLGVPHLASSVRLPVSVDLIQAHHEYLWLLRSLITASGPPPATVHGTEPYPRLPVSAPFLLALVLRDMQSPTDFGNALASLRDRFEPLRRWVREHPDRKQWEGKPQQVATAYTKPLPNEYADRFGEIAARAASERHVDRSTWADLVAGIADGSATLIGLPGLAGPGTKLLMATQGAGPLRRRWIKWRSPHVYLLFDLSKDVTQIAELDADIRRIWDDATYVTDRAVIDRLARFRGDPLISGGRLVTAPGG
jgi:hypothetical protein